MVIITVRKAFDGKASYSMVKNRNVLIKNRNVLIMSRASQAVRVPSYTKPLSKIGVWIRISQIVSEYQQFAEAGKLCVLILSRMSVSSYRSNPDYME